MAILKPINSRLLCALLCIATSATLSYISAQLGAVKQTINDGKNVIVTCESGSITITPYSDNIVRVLPRTVDMKGEAKPSASVVLSPKAVYKVIEHKSDVSILIGNLTVEVDRATSKVTFKENSTVLLQEYANVSAKNESRVYSFSSSAESYYGAGERGQSVKLNGDTLINYNKQNYGYGRGDRTSQMNITMPYYLSSKGYGVFFDDYSASKLILRNPVEYVTPLQTPLAYYFILGNAKGLGAVVDGFTQLTGRQDLIPFWSLGYITSKYGYKTQEETVGVIDSLKQCGYPVDGIVLDIYWYGKETDMGRYDWMPSQWSNPTKMLADLKAKGVKMVLISQPYLNKNGAIDNYNMAKAAGMLGHRLNGDVNDVTTWVGDAGMLDVSNPTTREWMWSRYKALTEQGVTGWWGDLGEPEVHPLTMYHHSGERADEYHNRYGNDWSAIIYDGFKKDFPDTRLMCLMRGGTAGLQRYSVFPWSTDVSRSWNGLQAQIPIMINSALSGLGYMSHDVGGFAVDKANPVDAELYVRWLQLGLFTPVLRTHSTIDAEPYHYKEYQSILLDIIKERYRWLPYNYTLAYHNATSGAPLVRPMNYNDPQNEVYSNIGSQYYWGEGVLVAPILAKGATSRLVKLLDGEWYDYNAPVNIYKGDTTISYNAPLQVMPIFIKAGSFIPTADYAMESTDDYDASKYTVTYYPKAGKSQYSLYEDNRKSNNTIAQGQYNFIHFAADNKKNTLAISLQVQGKGYKEAPSSHDIAMKIVSFSKAPSKVLVDSRPLDSQLVNYDEATKVLTIAVKLKKSAKITIVK
ncbi:MAG: glycoside hydrolase family 31 protein [Muribaculaceae bacterium]|nr:glycoside hydrolase family 31 protein [Muribaculaceae bacterium]